MKFEGFTAKQEVEPPLDEVLFKRLKEFSNSLITDVRPELPILLEQKEAFLSGEIECPHLTYEKILSKDYESKEKGLLELKDDIRSDSTIPEAISRAYIWTINERIARFRMLRELQKTMQEGNDEYHMKRFSRYSEFIYGAPEEDIYQGVTEKLYEKLEHARATLPPEKMDAYERLLTFASKKDTTSPEVSSEGSTQEQDISDEVINDPEEIKKYFQSAVEEMGLGDEWTVEIDPKNERSSFAVLYGSKKIMLPSEEKMKLLPSERKMTVKMIRGLIVHEIGTHALRQHNGIRSRLRLLSVGLDRNEVGEEGLATYREHRETGKTDFAGFDNYFAAGLAKGIDGGGQRNFAGVYSILHDYYSVTENVDNEKAQDMAWDRCLRIFRGTTGDIPGVILTKDIIYRKGNIATYSLMKNDFSEKIDFNIGKFDPTNPRHIAVLTELGILDSDLENLNQE